MKKFWAAFGSVAIKAGIWAIGHEAAIVQVATAIGDKNVVGVLHSAADIVAASQAPHA